MILFLDHEETKMIKKKEDKVKLTPNQGESTPSKSIKTNKGKKK